MPQTRIVIIHGWDDGPGSHWYQWLKKELENKGASVSAPQMPNAKHPQLTEWLAELKATIGSPDNQLILVGHSLGCITALRYLETIPENLHIKGTVLVAGFPELLKNNELKNFFVTPLNENKIRAAGGKIIAINATRDPYVPIINGHMLRDRLGAELIEVDEPTHFLSRDGYPEFPLVLEKILELID